MFMTWGGVQDFKFLAFIEEEEELDISLLVKIINHAHQI